jgi:hypothetical protein
VTLNINRLSINLDINGAIGSLNSNRTIPAAIAVQTISAWQ